MEKGIHVYHSNIDGLKVKGTTPWPDPKDWRDLPAGAVLFVDEAQVFFPARRGGEPPEAVMMNRIRHDGIRLVLATQQPNYLDTHLRGLIGYHEHLLRKSGKEMSFIFRNNQVIDEVRAPLARIKKLYDYENWKFPKRYFKCYESAEVHTVKYQMPALVKKALMIAPVAALLLAGAFYGVFRDSMFARADEPEEAAVSDGGASGASPAAHGPRPTLGTPQAYAEQFTAMIKPAPWTAPAYLQRQAVAQPVVACMTSGAGQGANGYREASYTCLTEQGTRYEMDPDDARDLARYGPVYNPFAKPSHEERQQAASTEPKRETTAAPRSIRGSVVNSDQMSHYCDIGVELKPGT